MSDILFKLKILKYVLMFKVLGILIYDMIYVELLHFIDYQNLKYLVNWKKFILTILYKVNGDACHMKQLVIISYKN